MVCRIGTANSWCRSYQSLAQAHTVRLECSGSCVYLPERGPVPKKFGRAKILKEVLIDSRW